MILLSPASRWYVPESDPHVYPDFIAVLRGGEVKWEEGCSIQPDPARETGNAVLGGGREMGGGAQKHLIVRKCL